MSRFFALPLCITLLSFTLVAAPARAELVVYTAELIRTMEPALPTATAVAVARSGMLASCTAVHASANARRSA